MYALYVISYNECNECTVECVHIVLYFHCMDVKYIFYSLYVPMPLLTKLVIPDVFLGIVKILVTHTSNNPGGSCFIKPLRTYLVHQYVLYCILRIEDIFEDTILLRTVLRTTVVHSTTSVIRQSVKVSS